MTGTLTTIGAGTYSASYYVTSAGVTLTNFGTIGGIGVSASAYTADIFNSGTILGSPNYGILLGLGGLVENLTGGTIGGATALAAGGPTTVVNAGSVLGGSNYGLQLAGGGTVTNQLGGYITGREAIQISDTAGSVANYGRIIGDGSYGVQLANGGAVTNHANSTISGYHGVRISSGGGVVNGGEIYGTAPLGFGVLLVNGGSVTNSAGGTITGSRGVGVLNEPGTVVNAGSIGGTLGVYLKAGGSVTNQSGGTIIGTEDAVKFLSGYTSRLVIDPQAVFNGTVYGGNLPGGTAVSTLELASATGIGMLSGLGSEYVGFTQTTIDSGAQWVLTGANTLAAGYSLTNAGNLTVSGGTLYDAGGVTNSGVIVLDAGTMTVGDLLGSGVVTIAASGTLEVTGSIASTETIVFGGDRAYLHLDSPANAAGSVTGLGHGNAIDLKGIDPASVSYAGGELSFTGGSFPLASTGEVPGAVASADGTELGTLCFCEDTLMATPSGLVTVQDLTVGDLVMTLGGAVRPIVWIGIGRVLATQGQRSAATPVIVRKHALVPGVPFRDLRVTKGHSLLIDGVLIPVEFLVNHRSILWDDRAAEVTLYHIELETHDILIANGARAESYRDDGNRWLFQNANSGWNQPAKAPCAPVLTGGAVVDAVWRRLLDRAGPRPGVPLTLDPDLHLVIDGRRLDARSRRDGVYVFELAERPGLVRIVSRAAAPQELGLARDPRTLGVAVRRLALCHGVNLRLIEAEDNSLGQGFHGFEPDNLFRWTNGDAVVPAALFDRMQGLAELEVHVAAGAAYIAEGDAEAAAA
jgi:hypothetical protein